MDEFDLSLGSIIAGLLLAEPTVQEFRDRLAETLAEAMTPEQNACCTFGATQTYAAMIAMGVR